MQICLNLLRPQYVRVLLFFVHIVKSLGILLSVVFCANAMSAQLLVLLLHTVICVLTLHLFLVRLLLHALIFRVQQLTWFCVFHASLQLQQLSLGRSNDSHAQARTLTPRLQCARSSSRQGRNDVDLHVHRNFALFMALLIIPRRNV